MSESMQNGISLVGRILLGLIFLMSGFGKITDFEGTSGYMAAYNMPAIPILLTGAIVFLLAGSLSLILGFKARLGASLLIIFLIPASLIFHAFWTLEDMEQRMQMINFMKNLSIMGGLLTIIAHGPGGISLDAKAAAKKNAA